jgi:serine/threonine protein kinase
MNCFLLSHHQPENILIDKSFTVVKLADLGSCRSIQNKPPFTEYIATRWYRAPECLITDGFYGQAMDVWGAGCVLFELLALYPLFPGTDEIDQINRIHRVLGSPTDQVFAKLVKTGSRYSHVTLQKQVGTGFTHLLAGTSQDCLDLLTMMLVYDFSERITSLQALKHPYLQEFENNVHHDVRAEIDVSRNLLDLSNKTLTAVSNSGHDHTHHLHLKSDNAHQPVNIKPIKGLIQESITHPSPSAKLSNLQRRKSSNVLNNATVTRRQSQMNTNHNHVKLPTIENNRRVYSHLNEPKRVDSNQQYRIEKISRPRNKLYANVASSGYGSSYNPTTNSLKEKAKSKPADSKGQPGKVYFSTLR